MNLFKSKLMNRIALWKAIGLLIWGAGFFMIPVMFSNSDMFLRFGLLFWYVTLWATIWIYGVWTKYPFWNISVPFWFRWILIWGWMNFVLALFMYDNLSSLMVWSIIEWCSPFWIVLEWAIFWLIVDTITTKVVWEGSALIK